MSKEDAMKVFMLNRMLQQQVDDYMLDHHENWYDGDVFFADFASMAKNEAIKWMLEGKDLVDFIDSFPHTDVCSEDLVLAAEMAREYR